MYNHIKGGADVVNLFCSHHATRLKSKRWPLKAFSFILGTIRTNSKTILIDNKVKLSNFDFTYALGKALVLPSIQNRYQNNNGIRLPIFQKVSCVLGTKETNRSTQFETPAALFGRSHVYVQEIADISRVAYKFCFLFLAFLAFDEWSDNKLLAFKVKATFKQKNDFFKKMLISSKLFKNSKFFWLFWIVNFILYMYAKKDLIKFSW